MFSNNLFLIRLLMSTTLDILLFIQTSKCGDKLFIRKNNNKDREPDENPTMEESIPKKVVPIVITNQAIFDKKYLCLKKQFECEMQKIDQEITRFSKNLTNLHDGSNSQQCSIAETTKMPNPERRKESAKDEKHVLENSPLVKGDGDEKCLKLMFDLSQYDPEEVKVTILEDMLLVEASHVEKTPTCTVYREYARQVQLPKGLDPEAVTSTLSSEGVLTVQAPLTGQKRSPKKSVLKFDNSHSGTSKCRD